MAALKALFAACILYLCYSSSHAYLSRVASLTSSVVEQSVAAHVQRNVFGHGKQLARRKREVVSKPMDDPQDCLIECRDNQTSLLTRAVIKNTARLVGLALENIDISELSDSSEKSKAAFSKKVEESTIANMGPLFEDLCRIHKNTYVCYSKCPDTQSRTVLSLDSEADQAAMCEPSRSWGNFSEYFTALNCTNTTENSKACDSKCGGRQQSLRNATKLSIDNESTDDEEFNEDKEDEDDDDADLTSFFAKGNNTEGGIILKYETDAKVNTAAAGAACKSISCHVECNKPIMTKQCGAKAYDLYNRMTKIEPHYSLAMLRVLKAVEKPAECNIFE